MAGGQSKKRSAYDRWVAVLQEEKCRYRIKAIKRSEILQVLEYEPGKRPRQFSSVRYRKDSDKDIENLALLCRRSSAVGAWEATGVVSGAVETWYDLVILVTQDVRARIAREGSRSNIEGALGKMKTWRGDVTSAKLRAWALEKDPTTQPAPFRNRIDTLAAIDKTKLRGKKILDLEQLLAELRAMKPTGAKKKEEDRKSEKIRAIPEDQQLQDWLDHLQAMAEKNDLEVRETAVTMLRQVFEDHGPNVKDWPSGWAADVAERSGRTKNSVQVLRSRMARHWPNVTGLGPADETFRNRGVKVYIQPYIVWVLALIATYGLRPSEAWHAERIDEDGWIVIPGDGKTKTERHIAPPVPFDWVERYKLRENFNKHQALLNSRWTIRWDQRGDLLIPVNNSQVSGSLRERFGSEIPYLRVPEWDNEWVRPYDLRHAYAVRCFTHPDCYGSDETDAARWMGHGLDVHKRTYLRWMSSTRSDEALKSKYRMNLDKPRPVIPVPAELPADVLERLAKLEQLEKIMGS